MADYTLKKGVSMLKLLGLSLFIIFSGGSLFQINAMASKSPSHIEKSLEGFPVVYKEGLTTAKIKIINNTGDVVHIAYQKIISAKSDPNVATYIIPKDTEEIVVKNRLKPSKLETFKIPLQYISPTHSILTVYFKKDNLSSNNSNNKSTTAFSELIITDNVEGAKRLIGFVLYSVQLTKNLSSRTREVTNKKKYSYKLELNLNDWTDNTFQESEIVTTLKRKQ